MENYLARGIGARNIVGNGIVGIWKRDLSADRRQNLIRLRNNRSYGIRFQTDVELHSKIADVMKKLVFAGLLLLSGCSPKIYKVTFVDGTYEYFELKKPQKNAKSIEYNGETILGVEKIEKLD